MRKAAAAIILSAGTALLTTGCVKSTPAAVPVVPVVAETPVPNIPQSNMPRTTVYVAPFVKALRYAGFYSDNISLSAYCKVDPALLPAMSDNMIPIDPKAKIQFVSIDNYVVTRGERYDSDSEILISCFGVQRDRKQAKPHVIAPNAEIPKKKK